MVVELVKVKIFFLRKIQNIKSLDELDDLDLNEISCEGVFRVKEKLFNIGILLGYPDIYNSKKISIIDLSDCGVSDTIEFFEFFEKNLIDHDSCMNDYYYYCLQDLEIILLSIIQDLFNLNIDTIGTLTTGVHFWVDQEQKSYENIEIIYLEDNERRV